MRAFKIGILIATVLTICSLSFFSKTDDAVLASEQCQSNTLNTATHTTSCQTPIHETRSSWFSWLAGDSRSAQFHYLDLLELLSSSPDEQKSRSVTPSF